MEIKIDNNTKEKSKIAPNEMEQSHTWGIKQCFFMNVACTMKQQCISKNTRSKTQNDEKNVSLRDKGQFKQYCYTFQLKHVFRLRRGCHVTKSMSRYLQYGENKEETKTTPKFVRKCCLCLKTLSFISDQY